MKIATKRRRESQTGFYHVVGKGINNEKIFAQQREKIYFKKIILKYIEKYDVEIFSYCIMSNHFHLIIKSEIQMLSSFMARVLAEYANYYNYKHHRNGHVFQNRFSSECIEDEAYFWNCIRYVHNNPVKAGMVKKPVLYKFSSMGEYVVEKPVLIHKKAIQIYQEKFMDKESFEEFHIRKQYIVVDDIKEEKMEQYMEIAMLIAKRLCKEENRQLLIQVFEEKRIREEYKKELRRILKVSKRKVLELYNAIYNQVENI